MKSIPFHTTMDLRWKSVFFTFLGMIWLTAHSAMADELRFSRHFSSGMVLQRDKPLTISGFAAPNSEVSLSISNQSITAMSNADGRWSLNLKPLPTNIKGLEMVVNSKGKKVILKNILVGDVFLLAKQTTIDISLNRNEEERKEAKNLPSVRLLSIRTIPSDSPRLDLSPESTSGWEDVSPSVALKMSATSFHVANSLSKISDAPIGIIDLNLGHHFPIAWMSREALMESEEIFPEHGARATQVLKTMEERVEEFNNEEARAKRNSKRPYPETHPKEDSRYPAAGYNAVLHPMRGLSLKGLLLQLGNNYPYILYERLVRNGTNTRWAELGQAYKDSYDLRKWCIYLEPCTTPRIPRQWRLAFGDMNLPVGWITPPGSDLVTMGRHHREMRELQRRVSEKSHGVSLILPGTEHIPFSAQPKDPKLTAERAMAWISGEVYGNKDTITTGPQFDRIETHYSKATVYFKEGTAKGLRANSGALDVFEVAGTDLEFKPASAKIVGQTIQVTSNSVNRITHVRYNWIEKPHQGLTNDAGLPALPFLSAEHQYPKVIDTIGEEKLPPEFSTPVSEWKAEGATIVKGRMMENLDSGKLLGPTGIKANTFGPNLYVNSALIGSPANGIILPGDYIYKVNGKTFGEKIFLDIANAITLAESQEGQGNISFDILREGKKLTVNLKLEVLGSYSSTSPYDCPKTENIVKNAERYLAKRGGVQLNSRHPHFQAADAMFLLAAGSPEYQGLVRRYVYQRIGRLDLTQPIDPNANDPKPQGGPWDLSADILLISEYYLATGDRNVLPYLRYMCDTLSTLQMRPSDVPVKWPVALPGQTGGWRHNFYGGQSYNPLAAVGVPATLGYHLTKEAGVKYNFEGYDRAIQYFLHNGAKIGSVHYGFHAEEQTKAKPIDHEAMINGKLDPGNGGVAGAALIFKLRKNDPIAHLCSHISTYCFNNTVYAHGGSFWANMYTPLGAKVQSKKAFLHYMKGNREYQELNRMFDHSRQQSSPGGYGAGELLAQVAPKERLRILGAHESVFGQNSPEVLKPALTAFYKRKYQESEKIVEAVMLVGGLNALELKKAQQLKDASALIQKSISLDLKKVSDLITEGKLHEASLDIKQLKMVLPQGHQELTSLMQILSDPANEEAIIDDKKRYGDYLKSMNPKGLIPKAKEEGQETWTPLLSSKNPRGSNKRKTFTPWKLRILESLDQAPDGWMNPDHDDSNWSKVSLPISWHTNHTALLRAPFEVKDKNSIKALRLSQYAFRQEDTLIYLNGNLIAKVSASGSGGKVRTFELNDYARECLREGTNVIAATYKNTWRWGRYFSKSETNGGSNSVYGKGVSLILEKQ